MSLETLPPLREALAAHGSREIAEDPAIIYEHVWRVGDLIMWDNLACLHARTDWPSEQRRALRRCTVEGEPLY